MKYPGLSFDQKELRTAMLSSYEDICNFITDPVFSDIFSEMMSLSPSERPKFVSNVWLDSTELERRGLNIPIGILVQTSAFGDRRPTLFVVKKLLPEKYHAAWENVNWTFNNDFEENSVPADPENSWRMPLKVSVQNALLSESIDLQSVDNEFEELFQGVYDNDIVISTKQPSGNDSFNSAD